MRSPLTVRVAVRSLPVSLSATLTTTSEIRLEDELEDLKVNRRKEVADKIKEAREQGDLSENAEYDAAKEAQGMLEMKINQLKLTISEARIIDTSKLKTDTVQVLTKVELKNVKTGMKMCYAIVPESEANLKEGKLAAQTPIGKALIGKKKGDVVEVNVPSGIIKFEIMDISI